MRRWHPRCSRSKSRLTDWLLLRTLYSLQDHQRATKPAGIYTCVCIAYMVRCSFDERSCATDSRGFARPLTIRVRLATVPRRISWCVRAQRAVAAAAAAAAPPPYRSLAPPSPRARVGETQRDCVYARARARATNRARVVRVYRYYSVQHTYIRIGILPPPPPPHFAACCFFAGASTSRRDAEARRRRRRVRAVRPAGHATVRFGARTLRLRSILCVCIGFYGLSSV